MSAKITNSPCFMDVMARVTKERIRQQELFLAGKLSFTCASHTADDNRKLRVLVEEVGEVAEAIDLLEAAESRGDGAASALRREELHAELVQVATVAVAWLESLEVKP
jgi:hypothetical protein